MEEVRTTLPDQEKLLRLEKIARTEGSGIEFQSLIGLWKFNTVWKQGSHKEDKISSTLLQVLSANLELKQDLDNTEKKQFLISNSIQFGLLSLRFSGVANIERKQPLLPFSFNNIQIKILSLEILNKPLPIPEERKKPFFALIAVDSEGKWLSARGKGGGLALWERDS